jgi:hypothetical protein
MSAEAELINAYREWYRLAEAESKAIQTRNWNLLSDCQTAIKDFQTLVSRLTVESREEWDRTGCNRAEKERHIQVLVGGLIELTRQNQTALLAARHTAQQRLDQLGEAGRNLKRLQRSYGLVPATARAGVS